MDPQRCLANLLELRILVPGPPLLGEVLDDRMAHRDDELHEDDRAAAFQVGRQLDPRQPPVAGALAAQVHEGPVRRVERAYPDGDVPRRGPQRHRPVTTPQGTQPAPVSSSQDLAMR